MDTNNLRIGARLGLAFGIVLSLMIAILVASSMVGTKNREQMMEGLNFANSKAELANGMKSAMLEASIAIRNMRIQSEVAAMEKEEAKVNDRRKHYVALRDKLTALKAIAGNGNVDYSSIDLEYVNVMNPAEPAVGYKSREPAPASPSPGAPTPPPNPCK